MEYRDIHALAQLLLDVETLWRLDIFQVDAAKGWLQRGHHVDKLIRVQLVNFNIKHVNAGELLK